MKETMANLEGENKEMLCLLVIVVDKKGGKVIFVQSFRH